MSGSYLTAITLNGSDVYMAGETNAGDYAHIRGTYWKNGASPVTVQPADTSLSSFAFAIASSGSEVDVAGSAKGYMATYWKNGTPTQLGNATIDGSYNYGIATSGLDVFVVGATTHNNLNVATLWKNNLPTYLTSVAPLHSMAKAIALNGPDVYIAGSTFDNIFNNNTTAYYWKNGTAVKLNAAGSKGGWANAIVVVPK